MLNNSSDIMRRWNACASPVRTMSSEDAGPDHAVGVWFPDLPGCFAAGDTLDEALQHAPEAIALWIEAQGGSLPRARTPSELRADADVAADMARHVIALIPAPDISLLPAAE